MRIKLMAGAALLVALIGACNISHAGGPGGYPSPGNGNPCQGVPPAQPGDTSFSVDCTTPTPKPMPTSTYPALYYLRLGYQAAGSFSDPPASSVAHTISSIEPAAAGSLGNWRTAINAGSGSTAFLFDRLYISNGFETPDLSSPINWINFENSEEDFVHAGDALGHMCDPGNHTITHYWNADSRAGVTGYNLYDSGGTKINPSVVVGTSYTEPATLTNGTTYYRYINSVWKTTYTSGTSTSLVVASTLGWRGQNQIVVGLGTGNQETVTIASVTNGTTAVLVAPGMINAHVGGDTVQMERAASDIDPLSAVSTQMPNVTSTNEYGGRLPTGGNANGVAMTNCTPSASAPGAEVLFKYSMSTSPNVQPNFYTAGAPDPTPTPLTTSESVTVNVSADPTPGAGNVITFQTNLWYNSAQNANPTALGTFTCNAGNPCAHTYAAAFTKAAVYKSADVQVCISPAMTICTPIENTNTNNRIMSDKPKDPVTSYLNPYAYQTAWDLVKFSTTDINVSAGNPAAHTGLLRLGDNGYTAQDKSLELSGLQSTMMLTNQEFAAGHTNTFCANAETLLAAVGSFNELWHQACVDGYYVGAHLADISGVCGPPSPPVTNNNCANNAYNLTGATTTTGTRPYARVLDGFAFSAGNADIRRELLDMAAVILDDQLNGTWDLASNEQNCGASPTMTDIDRALAADWLVTGPTFIANWPCRTSDNKQPELYAWMFLNLQQPSDQPATIDQLGGPLTSLSSSGGVTGGKIKCGGDNWLCRRFGNGEVFYCPNQAPDAAVNCGQVNFPQTVFEVKLDTTWIQNGETFPGFTPEQSIPLTVSSAAQNYHIILYNPY